MRCEWVSTEIASSDPWEALLGTLGQCHFKLSQVRPDEFPMTYPGTGVRLEEVTRLEDRLGYSLDNQLKALLLRASGWPNMFGDISLLGLHDLADGPGWARAGQLLSLFYGHFEGPADASVPLIGELFPVAVSGFQSDVISIIRTGELTNGGHPVLWLSGGVIERFDSVRDMLMFFSAQLSELVEAYGSSGEASAKNS